MYFQGSVYHEETHSTPLLIASPFSPSSLGIIHIQCTPSLLAYLPACIHPARISRYTHKSLSLVSSHILPLKSFVFIESWKGADIAAAPPLKWLSVFSIWKYCTSGPLLQCLALLQHVCNTPNAFVV